jgi:erythronate-4-phosphate dehydrogenase
VSQKRLSIVADENIPAVEEMFQEAGDRTVVITKVDGRRLTAEQVQEADVLLVRSVTKVNEALLTGSKVRFVGSATIGTDHLDKGYLEAHGIHYCSAPGCNADAVVEYVLCCLSTLLDGGVSSLKNMTVAVVGVGNVGSRLVQRLQRIGVKNVLLNDPLRAQNEPGFSDLETCFEQADVVAMHTPLTKDGKFPSYHLVKTQLLEKLKFGAVLINAGRGPAIKEQDLFAFLKTRSDIKTVMDVWEHEPVINSELAALVDIATPHIAGYSLEGKVRGTYMLRCALSKWQGESFEQPLTQFLPQATLTNISLSKRASIADAMRVVYEPSADDKRFRKSLTSADQPLAFDQLRKNYPERREFYSLKVTSDENLAIENELQKLGFSVA